MWPFIWSVWAPVERLDNQFVVDRVLQGLFAEVPSILKVGLALEVFRRSHLKQALNVALVIGYRIFQCVEVECLLYYQVEVFVSLDEVFHHIAELQEQRVYTEDHVLVEVLVQVREILDRALDKLHRS